MMDTEFDRRLDEIEQEAAGRHEKADAYRDQQHASLFREAETQGWTQERIAKRVGKSRKWVEYRLRLARFLAWLGTSGSQPEKRRESLTERRFRAIFARTESASKARKGKAAEAAEEERFAQVARLLDTESQPAAYVRLSQKPGLRKAVRELMSDGKWRFTGQIVKELQQQFSEIPATALRDNVSACLRQPPTGYFVEAHKVNRQMQWRFRRGEQPGKPAGECLASLADALPAIIEELKQWGEAHETQMNPTAIKRLAIRLERIAGPLLQQVPA